MAQAHYGSGSTSFLPSSASKGVVVAGAVSNDLAVDVASHARDAVLRALAEGGYESMHWKVDSGEPFRANGILASQEWHCACSPLAWSSAGLWDGAGAGTDGIWKEFFSGALKGVDLPVTKSAGKYSTGLVEKPTVPSLTAAAGLVSEQSGMPVDLPRSAIRPL